MMGWRGMWEFHIVCFIITHGFTYIGVKLCSPLAWEKIKNHLENCRTESRVMEKKGSQKPMIHVAPNAGYWVDGNRDDYYSAGVDLSPPKGSTIELDVDNKAKSYGRSFVGRKHWNWAGIDKKRGPYLVSMAPKTVAGIENVMILRRSLRGMEKKVKIQHYNPEMMAPISKEHADRKLYIYCDQSSEKLIRDYDEYYVSRSYISCALFYQKKNEEKNGKHAISPAFVEFLNLLGSWSPGVGMFTIFQQRLITFYVPNLISSVCEDVPEQLKMKQSLGSEKVAMIFQEEDVIMPFVVKTFYDAFIVVRPFKKTHYKVIVAALNHISNFGATLPNPIIIPKGPGFKNFIISFYKCGQRLLQGREVDTKRIYKIQRLTFEGFDKKPEGKF